MVERSQRLVEWRVLVIPVRLVEVDTVDLQTTERRLDRLQDVITAQDLVSMPHVGAHFGRDDDVVVPSSLCDPASDDRFRFATLVSSDPPRIGVRRVDQVEAGADEGVEQPERHRLVRRPAEHIAAQGERRDLESGITELASIHAEKMGTSLTSLHPCLAGSPHERWDDATPEIGKIFLVTDTKSTMLVVCK